MGLLDRYWCNSLQALRFGREVYVFYFFFSFFYCLLFLMQVKFYFLYNLCSDLGPSLQFRIFMVLSLWFLLLLS